MKIIHQITHNWEKEQVRILSKYNVSVEEGFSVILLDENEKYFDLKPFFDEWNVLDWVGTEFTNDDIKKSKYAVLLERWLNDYPQPENNYLEETYDLKDYCSNCGIGAVQKAPFRIKKEPKWSDKKQLFQLNWIFDELFVAINWYEQVFKPFGIKSKPVVLHKSNKFSESVVQIEIPEIQIPLEIENYSWSKCEKCNRKKYLPITRGYFPKTKYLVDLNIFKTMEWFGSGAAGDKRIIISENLKAEFLKNKFFIDYHPLESPAD